MKVRVRLPRITEDDVMCAWAAVILSAAVWIVTRFYL